MKILGVCGGNGVILYPMRGDLIGNIEPRNVFYTPGELQWRLNFDQVPFYKKYEPGLNPDVIIGAPNCGHSSVLSYSRIKKLSDPRDDESMTLYLKAIEECRPKVFLMENLSKLLEEITQDDLKTLFPEYKLIFHEHSVWEWGNSQKNRVRLVIIGVRRDYKQYYDLFSRVYPVNEHKTCKQLTNGLEYGKIGHIRESINSRITLYAGFKTSAAEIQEGWLKNDWTRWQVTGRNFGTAPGVYRNLEGGHPNTARKANRQYNPEGLMMTPRELARIQGVPDNFEIAWDLKLRPEGFWINKGRLTVTKCPPMEIAIWFKELLQQMTEL
jgi:site-specific DNA-cytosine methylase